MVCNANAVLLTSPAESQIEGWLGVGNQDFVNIFTKTPGDTSTDFHAAADGMGATISILSVIDGLGHSHTIGGYNPLSWSSSGSHHITGQDSERTAFLFNITEDFSLAQVLGTSPGNWQTYNDPNYGPVFGGGFDLLVAGDLNNGYVSGSPYSSTPGGLNVLGHTGAPTSLSVVQELEVYTFSSAVSTPDTGSTLALLGISALGLAVMRKRLV